MKKFAKAILSLIPHAIIVISLMMITFYITDRYNRAMAFINNDITKALLLILSVLAIIQSIYMIYTDRKRRWEDYRSSKREDE